MYNDIHRQTTEILLQRDMLRDSHIIRPERDYLSDYERRAIEQFRQQDAEINRYRHYNRYPEPPRSHFRNELHRLRFIFGTYVESLDTVKLTKAVASATNKLISTLKRSRNPYRHLIQILREQKRLQQKIKLLYLPIKIIPDSLRPIDSVA